MRALTTMTSAGCEAICEVSLGAATGAANARIDPSAKSRSRVHSNRRGRRVVFFSLSVIILYQALSGTSRSECRRRVDPQQPGLAPSWILPMMRHRALKIKAVAPLQVVLLALK